MSDQQQMILHDLYVQAAAIRPGYEKDEARVWRVVIEALIYLVGNTPDRTPTPIRVDTDPSNLYSESAQPEHPTD